MDTPLIQLEFSCEALEEGLSPLFLFGLRKRFQPAFSKAVGCWQPTGGCTAGDECPCRQVFSRELATDPDALRRFQKPPLPFAFRLPLLDEELLPGDGFSFSLVLTGSCTNHLETCIAATRAALPGSIRISSTSSVAFDGSRRKIPMRSGCPDLTALPIISMSDLMQGGDAVVDHLTISIETPLRLLSKGYPLRTVDFSVLAGALFRRISSLAYYYGGVEPDFDFKWLAEKAREISIDSSHAGWVSWGGSIQGVLGNIEISGDLSELLPFLKVGELLNVGKGAAYGMGSYRLSVEHK